MRMWSGRAFQVAGPACENARSPNFVRTRGIASRGRIDQVVGDGARRRLAVMTGSRGRRVDNACEAHRKTSPLCLLRDRWSAAGTSPLPSHTPSSNVRGRFAASSHATLRRSLTNAAIFGVAARGNWANGRTRGS